MSSATKKPMRPIVVEARREVCGRCDQQCEAFRAGRIDFADPRAQCLRPWPQRWGCYGDCSDPQTARSPALESSLTRPPKPPEPTAAELTTSLGYAAFRAARAAILGERVVLTDPEFRARAAACAGCEFWDAAARGGLGKCRVCGCTQLKLWLATERCPKGRWPALSSAPTAPQALRSAEQDPSLFMRPRLVQIGSSGLPSGSRKHYIS